MNIIIIGLSGHSYVVIDCLKSKGFEITMYCEKSEKIFNNRGLKFIGSEKSEKALKYISNNNFFISIGNNHKRASIYKFLKDKINYKPINATHNSAIISKFSKIGNGILFCPGVIINANVEIGNGVICNTSCVIEHEVKIADFAHVAPGSVICGNVTIGSHTFIGANSVIKEGVKIGNNVVVGAGSTVLKDIEDNVVIFGTPAKIKK